MAVIIIFGVPGSGKTTQAAKIVKKNLKKGIPTYSNVEILGSLLIDVSYIGKYDLSDADLIIDEASIEFNNRNYKSLPQSTIKWFKKYRHHGIRNIYIFSQSYDDMDITLRRLADVMFITRKSIIPGLFINRRIRKSIDVDKESKQIIDAYAYLPLSMIFVFGPLYWNMFDSWEAEKLPKKRIPALGYEKYDLSPDVLKMIYKNIKIRRKKKRNDYN